MTAREVKRKLTAIFSADVKGYSRLMREDEVATVDILRAYRKAMSALIQKHRGRVVDTPGDNLLAEFGSVVDAVQCAVEVQQELKARNAELSENRRMEFRIGVNLGDVIEEEERIYGDGVNVAARVEGLADAGGICISGTAFDHVKTKLPVGYEYLGEQTVKNIPESVRVYRVLMEPEAAGKVISEKRPGLTRRQRVALAAALVVVVAAVAVWYFHFRPSPMEVASEEKMAFPLPEKPSIAVLPFDNLTGDPQQEYFSDGMTEEIITALSKVPYLFVIARNSTFSYKGKPVKIHQVAQELGVRYVLEGSVRRTEDRVRVTAQLIDAIKGHHLWAERYDRDLKDIFALQDEITMKIIEALEVKLTEGEQARMRRKGTDELEAYIKTLHGVAYLRQFNREGNILARQMGEQAIALDPEYARPYVVLGWTHLLDILYGSTKSPKKSMERAIELVQKSISLDEFEPCSRDLLSYIYLLERQHERAIAEAERGISLDPNMADSQMHLAMALSFAGRPEEAVALLKKAIRLNPFAPTNYWHNLGRAYRLAGRYEEAIEAYKKALKLAPDNLLAHVGLVATYSLSGQEDEAQAEAKQVLRVQPKFSVERFAKRLPFKDRAETERLIEALRKAGLPKTPPLALPDKPSIAVLPFTNISDDPQQEYFAEGMTDDLITDLSKISGLFVIARNSAFTYKGKPVKVDQISRELGVRYVLEGSVRKADDRVRINAQLIDATTGGHLWAERYDGKLGDIFALQDKVTQKIVAALAVKLTASEEQQITRKGTDNIAAYDAFLQGWQHYRRITRDDLAKAVTYLKKAIELDPNYGRAHAALAGAYWLSYRRRWSWEMDWPYEVKSRAPLLAHEHLETALQSPTSLAHQVASWILVHEPLHEEAIAEAERAIALNPNDVDNLFAMARALIFGGRPAEGTDYVKRAMRLDPHYPAQYLSFLGLAQFCLGQLEEAAITLERAHKRNPELEAYPLVATYAHLGREEEAADLLAEYLRKTWEGGPSIPLREIQPRVRWVLTYYPFKNQADTDRFADGLRKVGLPLKRATYTFALDPYCKSAYELMAYVHLRNVWFGWSKSPGRSLELAQRLAQKAVASAESSPEARAVLGLTYLMKREHEKAIAEGERAVALGPNNTIALLQLAWTLRHTARPEEAIALEKKAIGLHPWGETAHFHNLGMAYFTARGYEEAISAFRKALEEEPKNQFAYIGLAAAYTFLGLGEKANAAAAKVLDLDPNFSLDHYAKILPFKNPDDRDQLINALRKAGLPD